MQFVCNYNASPLDPHGQPSASRAGFTLVEVILAVGLAATTLLTLVTLMASGLAIVADSSTAVASAQITRSLVTRVQSADWQLSTDYSSARIPASVTGGVFYFDDQGASCAAGTTQNASFTARLDWLGNDVVLPGAPRNAFMRRISVRVAAGVRTSGFFEQEKNARAIHTTHTAVATRMPLWTPGA